MPFQCAPSACLLILLHKLAGLRSLFKLSAITDAVVFYLPSNLADSMHPINTIAASFISVHLIDLPILFAMIAKQISLRPIFYYYTYYTVPVVSLLKTCSLSHSQYPYTTVLSLLENMRTALPLLYSKTLFSCT